MSRLSKTRRRAFALLIVVLTIAALAIIALPFALSMKLRELSSRSAVAEAKARFAVTAAYNHALAQLLQATNEYGETVVRFDDTGPAKLPDEFRYVRGQRGVILAATVEDEQGKVNLNDAGEWVLDTLFRDPDVGLGLSDAAAARLAAAVLAYRQADGPLPSIDVLCSRGAVTPEQLDALRPHVTVHSVAEQPAAFSRLNWNTASLPVMRAALVGVRARYVQPTPAPANKGNGAMSLVELLRPISGIWEATCTSVTVDAGTGAKTFTFSLESYPEDDPTNRTTHGILDASAQPQPFRLVELPNTPAVLYVTGDNVAFSICNGTVDFEQSDKFTFRAEPFSCVGDPTTINVTRTADKVNKLLKRFRAKVVSADITAGTGKITLDDAAVFPLAGWVFIRGDAIRYANRVGNELQGCTDVVRTPAPGESVALIVSDFVEFDARLAEAATAGDIAESDRSALVANAKAPYAAPGAPSPSLLNATVGLCFRPSGRYTIQAHGVVNNSVGREEKVLHVRRVVALERGAAGEPKEWKLKNQADLDEQIVARALRDLVTIPASSYLADVPPAGGTDPTAGVRLAPIDEGGDGWGFDGPTLFGASNRSNGLGQRHSPAAPDPSRAPSRDVSFVPGADGDKGLLVSGGDRFCAFAAPAAFAVDGTLRRIVVWVKPSASFPSWYSADHVFLDTALENLASAADKHTNRLLLSYTAAGKLVFRIADEAREPRSAEVQAAVTQDQFARGAWHRIDALWAGMEIGEMALLLDGRLIGAYSPSAASAEQTAAPPLANEKWIVRVANYLKQDGTPGAVRDTQAGTTAGPTSVYGYGACRFINRDCSTRKNEFNKVHRGSATLSDPLGNKPRLTSKLKIKQPPPPAPPVKLAADALVVPVEDASEFPKRGFIRVDDEVIEYTDWTYNATDACHELTVPAGGRGRSFGDNVMTRFATTAAEHDNMAPVVSISMRISDNSKYPMPQYVPLGPGVGEYFGISGLDPNSAVVQVEDEWIGYTHRDGDGFLVNVNIRANDASSMRGASGTTVAAHAAARDVVPVYEVTAGGRPGPGDRVTLLDDDLAAQAYEELVIWLATKSQNGYFVSFGQFLPAALDLYIRKGTTARNARLVKFPSGRFRPQRLVSIGAPMSGAAGRAEATIGSARIAAYPGGDAAQRAKEPIDGTSSGGFDCVIGQLESLYNGGTEWQWASSEFGLGYWPLKGYVQIGGEALLYKVRWPHNIGYSNTLGALSQSASATIYGDTGVAATGNVVWTRQFAASDPITAGFNPFGGHMVITSYSRTQVPESTRTLTNCSDEQLQWLIDQGYLPANVRDQGTRNPDGTWNFPPITVPGGWTTSEKREFVFYSKITPDKPGLDRYEFVCDDAGRHLYNTHKDTSGQPLGHERADDGQGGWLYPTLSARTVALTILQRGGAPGNLGLGTTRSAHDAGSRALFVPSEPLTMICGPSLDANGNPAPFPDADKIPVEDVSNFPPSGYVEITDASGAREIIYYTRQETAAIAGSDPPRNRYFLAGIKDFRGRFGTKPIDLSGLTPLDDVRKTSEHITDYRDPRRIARLFRPRVHDRMPLQITLTGGAETARNYAPHQVDADLVYFEAKKTIRGAKWLAVDWTESLSPGTDIIVLAQVGDSPSWSTAVPVGSGGALYKFDTPDAANTINAVGDTITIRVFFQFNPGYDTSAQQVPVSWQVPVLRSLSVLYEADTRIVESEVLDY